MAITKVVVASSKSNPANGIVILIVAIYLGLVIYQGNLGLMLSTLYDDMFGKGPHGYAFWQWAIALTVLVYLAENDQTSDYFYPLLIIVLIGMLIQLATKQPSLFSNLNAAIKAVLGGQ